jgi:hypothetical protein
MHRKMHGCVINASVIVAAHVLFCIGHRYCTVIQLYSELKRKFVFFFTMVAKFYKKQHLYLCPRHIPSICHFSKHHLFLISHYL